MRDYLKLICVGKSSQGMGWRCYVKPCYTLLFNELSLFRWNFSLNILRSEQDGRHFTGDIFQMHFRRRKVFFVFWDKFHWRLFLPINNNSALVQVLAWCRIDGKPLPEPMVIEIHAAIWDLLIKWVLLWPVHEREVCWYTLRVRATCNLLYLYWISHCLSRVLSRVDCIWKPYSLAVVLNAFLVFNIPWGKQNSI